MATVNFSIPDEIRDQFNAAFSGQNKSRVIAKLMRMAVEEQRRQKQRASVVKALLALRRRTGSASERQVRAARRRGRP